jgi:hypothetical protein
MKDKKELYLSLIEAYSEKNLTKITSRIISLYKNKDFDSLRSIMDKISKTIGFSHTRINRIFSKLVMLYHPDKLSHYKLDIDKYNIAGDQVKLEALSHIFVTMDNIERTPSKSHSSDHRAAEQQRKDFEEHDTDIPDIDDIVDGEFWDDDDRSYDIDEKEEDGYNILSAVKLKEYGNLDVKMNLAHLADIEGELELSNYDIDDLSGIENCINITSLDLSANHISDISKISDLTILEDIDLSNNLISDIHVLSYLVNLKNIDLSHNSIDDISALKELDELEYLNIIGNEVSQKDIDELKSKGVVVIH